MPISRNGTRGHPASSSAAMPNVQLPPKESNLFKRILVSGCAAHPRQPRARRGELSGGDGACAAGPGPPGFFVCARTRTALPPPRRARHPALLPPSAAAPSRIFPPQSPWAWARRPGVARALCGAWRPASQPPLPGPPQLLLPASLRPGVRSLLYVESIAQRTSTPLKAGAIL